MSRESERYKVQQRGEAFYVVDTLMWCGTGIQRGAHLVCVYESPERASRIAHQLNQEPPVLTTVRYYLVALQEGPAQALVRETSRIWRREYFDEQKIEWREDARMPIWLDWDEMRLPSGPPRRITWEAAMRELEDRGGKPDGIDLAA